ncbi:hypothetical protein SCALM49S_08495 [Streptomyces californicus]
MQAPAARSLDGSTVRSWQPVVLETPGFAGAPGLPPSGKRTGKLTIRAFCGAFTGTLMMEIPSCGGRQSGNASLGEYEETYTYTFLPSGTSVCVWEPQAVSTAAMYLGCRLLLMSKIFMPSQEDFSVAGWEVLEQESSLREESVERNSRFPETEMSFCEPGQRTWETVFGFFGLLMS